MAARKRKTATRKTGSFYAASSECGDLSQFAFISGKGHATAEAAKEEAVAHVEHQLLYVYTVNKVFVVQIVAEGSPSGVEWK